MKCLTVEAFSEIRLGKMKSSGIWFEEIDGKKERVVVRIRKSKKEWFEQKTFPVDKFQDALDFYNSCVTDKVRLTIKNQSNDELMRLPLFDLIEQCILAMESRKSEPWASKEESTVFNQISFLKRFRDRYFTPDASADSVNLQLDDLRVASQKNERLKIYEKNAKDRALALIGNMTLEDVRKIAADHDSDNGFKVLIEKVCFSKNTAKNTATVVREFLEFIRRKRDPERKVTGWLPTESDFKKLRLHKDNTVKRETRNYYKPEEVKKLLTTWEEASAEDDRLCKDHPLLFELGLYAGPRIGELTGLTADDIDYSNKRLRIKKTATRNLKNKIVIGDETKNKKERFSLQLPEKLILKIKDKVSERSVTDLVFKSKNDTIIDTASFNKALKKICARANVKYLSSHMAMRKTFINMAIRQIMKVNGHDFEAALATVAKASGHSVAMCRQSYYVQEETDASIANDAVKSLYDEATPMAVVGVDPRDEKIARLEAEILALKAPAPKKRKVSLNATSPEATRTGLKTKKIGSGTSVTDSDEAA